MLNPLEGCLLGISIVVPMCNERDSIGQLRAKLEALQKRLSSRYKVEYVLVDDGSTDGTGELMSGAVPDGCACICVRHRENLGIGAAFRSGFRRATGDVVCTIDADCSYAPEELSTLIEMVVEGKSDIAVASPYHPKGSVVGVEPWRLFLSTQCSFLYRQASRLKLYTYTSICRAYRREIVRELPIRSNGFVSAVEILLAAYESGYSIGEVPAVLNARRHGYSKMRIARTVKAHVLMLLRAARMRVSDSIRAFGITGRRKRMHESEGPVICRR